MLETLPKMVNLPIKTNTTKLTITKERYLDYVFLSKDEYQKLTNKYPRSIIKNKIEDLNNYIGSKGKRYKNHYHTILAWLRRDKIPEKIENTQASLQEMVS